MKHIFLLKSQDFRNEFIALKGKIEIKDTIRTDRAIVFSTQESDLFIFEWTAQCTLATLRFSVIRPNSLVAIDR